MTEGVSVPSGSSSWPALWSSLMGEVYDGASPDPQSIAQDGLCDEATGAGVYLSLRLPLLAREEEDLSARR